MLAVSNFNSQIIIEIQIHQRKRPKKPFAELMVPVDRWKSVVDSLVATDMLVSCFVSLSTYALNGLDTGL